MKITFFIGSMGSGGAERVLSILANYYAKKGWNVDIVLLLEYKINYDRFQLNSKINIVNLCGKSKTYMWNVLYWLRSIHTYVRRRKPDCIVSFVGRINALVLTSVLCLGIPVLVSERSDPKHDGRSKAMIKFCDLIYRTASVIVFQTKYAQSCFSKVLYQKSCIIPNPIIALDTSNIQIDSFEICTAGRLAEVKNHSLLIDAINLVRLTIPKIKCKIYGEGVCRKELEYKIGQLKLENNISLEGEKKDIEFWVAKSSIFVSSSNYEGASNALMEAMMLGKACISTNYPGVDEIIKDGVNGIIVPLCDHKALAKAICSLIENPEKRERLGNNAAEYAKKYKADIVVAKWDEAIQRILK